jgi:hypothetical protein
LLGQELLGFGLVELGLIDRIVEDDERRAPLDMRALLEMPAISELITTASSERRLLTAVTCSVRGPWVTSAASTGTAFCGGFASTTGWIGWD